MSDQSTQVVNIPTTDIQPSNIVSNNVQPLQVNQEKQVHNSPMMINNQSNKQKLFKIKEGQILRYKKRLFSSNWRPAQLTLYSNATFVISSRRIASPALISCNKNSTLIVFGQQLDFIPKRPSPPPGYKVEHMLAIGLINHAYNHYGRLKGTQIVFYWFSLSSQEDLMNWVVAFQNSLHSDTVHTTKTTSDIQAVTNDIAMNNVNNIANINCTTNARSTNPNDDLSMCILMTNTAALNTGGIGTGTGLAALGAAGLLATNAQYQALLDSQDIGTNTFMLDMMNGRSGNSATFGDGYFGDAVSQVIDPLNNQLLTGNNWQANEAVPIAEMATIMNAANILDCGTGINCGADCSIDASGGDCSFGDTGGLGDFSFAFL